MTIDAPEISSDASAAPGRDLASLLIPPAMMIAAAAMGVASHLHLGLTVEIAFAVGVALFCVMLLCHVLLRAADAAERAAEEAVERGIPQVESPMPRELSPRMPAASRRPSPVGGQPVPMPPYRPGPVEVTPPPLPEPAIEPPAVAVDPPAAVAMTGASDRLDAASEVLDAPVPLAAASPAGWAFRPVDVTLAPIDPPVAGTYPSAAPPLGSIRPRLPADLSLPVGETSRSAEADRIDAILKRLAAQIQAGSSDSAVRPQVPPTDPTSPDANGEAAEGGESERALSSAVDALRSTVEAMRASLEPVAPAVAPAPAPEPQLPSAVELRLAAVAEALAAERVDVFLSPILGLVNAQAQHFEVSVQLRSAAGEALDGRGIAGIAGGAGLLPLLDALNVRHAAGFALKLERRGRDGAVFSEIGGRSLESETFVGDVAGRHAQGIADRMVLSFAQSELKSLGPAQIAALEDLARLGFRFALQGVADLDMDFEALEAVGFEFVKLDAPVFLRGLECAGAEIPASDICRYFDDLGLTVIVGGIEDETTRAQMLGCGVALGQGGLFGRPVPVPVAGAEGTLAA